jgi:hypothetical protein
MIGIFTVIYGEEPPSVISWRVRESRVLHPDANPAGVLP